MATLAQDAASYYSYPQYQSSSSGSSSSGANVGSIVGLLYGMGSSNAERGGGSGIGPQFSSENTKEENKKAGFMNLIDPGNTFMGLWNKKKKKTIQLPTYYLDPYYDKTQSDLYGLGSGLLSGNVNDYYAGIGMTGSKEFEDMLNIGKRDIMAAGDETIARLGIRGGRAAGAIAGAISDYETKNRYADYERALAGKQFLLSTGIGALADVRSGALTQSEMLNNFNQNTVRLQMGLAGMESDAAKASGEATGSMISSLANLYGAYSMNKGSGSGAVSSGSSTGSNRSLALDASEYYSGAGYLAYDPYQSTLKLGSV